MFLSKILSGVSFEKFYQEYHSSVIQNGSRSVPTFWVQSVCKGYVGKEFNMYVKLARGASGFLVCVL